MIITLYQQHCHLLYVFRTDHRVYRCTFFMLSSSNADLGDQRTKVSPLFKKIRQKFWGVPSQENVGPKRGT